MISEKDEVKNSIYVGMSIFNMIKNSIVEVANENISFEDKKYLSLYLGIVNSENKISNEFSNLFSELHINYELLDMSSYMDLYVEHFVNIFKDIDFDSISNYYNYLTQKEIIKKVNMDILLYKENIGNKRLVKKIN